MTECREPYDVLFVDNKFNLIGVIGLRSITNHHWTPCIGPLCQALAEICNCRGK